MNKLLRRNSTFQIEAWKFCHNRENRRDQQADSSGNLEEMWKQFTLFLLTECGRIKYKIPNYTQLRAAPVPAERNATL